MPRPWTAPEDNPKNYQTVEPAYLAVMAVAVRLYRHTASNGYGEETYDEEFELIPAYLEGSDEDFVNEAGNQVFTTGVAYLGFVVPWLTVNDRLDVPDTAEASGWRQTSIGGIVEAYGPERIHHQEVKYGPLGQAGMGVGSG